MALYTAFTLLSLLVIACFVIALIANEGELYAKSYNESRNDIIENQIKYEMHNFAWASLCHNVAYSDCDVPMVITDSNEEVVADTVVEERLAGTLAANMISVQRGAKIVRVHDVKETNDVLNVMKYLS